MDLFPIDVIAHILTKVDGYISICASACVCKRWNEASKRHCVSLTVLRSLTCCKEGASLLWDAIKFAMEPIPLWKAVAALNTAARGNGTTSCCQGCNEHQYSRCLSFDYFPMISESLLRGIYAYGFEKPSDIQQQAIAPLAL